MSGQPVKSSSDQNKFRNEYLETLALQESINDMNLQANKTYLLTGQLPPQSQLQDTRTNAEKLADVEKLKRDTADSLRPIAEPQLAYAIINKVINSPLNVDNTLFRFLAQRAPSLTEQLKKLMPYGIAGDENDIETIVNFIKNMYSEQQGKFQSTKSYLNSINSQGSSSRIIGGNDIDVVIKGLEDIFKNIELIKQRSTDKFMGLPGVGNLLRNLQQLRNLNISLSLLKNSLPDTEQINMLMKELDNPDPLNPVPYNRRDLEAFYSMLEKLPKYSEAMSIVNKINQYINNNNYNLASEGIKNIVKLFSEVSNIPPPLLAQFTQIKDRQINKQNELRALQSEQTIRDIKQQYRANDEMSKAQKVFIVNDDQNAVYIRPGMGATFGGAPATAPTAPTAPAPPTSLASLAAGAAGAAAGAAALYGANNYSQYYSPEYLFNESMGRNFTDIPELDYVYNPNHEYRINNVKFSPTTGAPLIDLFDTDTNVTIPDMNYQKIRNFFGGDEYIPPSILNFLQNPAIGNGLVKRRQGRPRGSGMVKPVLLKPKTFVGFGINEINQKQLENGIVKIRRNTKTNYPDMPSKRVSKNLQGILKTIVGGGVPKYEELGRLDEEEKEYLNKIVSRSNLTDKLSVPAPSKDQREKDIHNFEVMRGQILSGNDSVELVKKFKLLIRKLSKQGLLPKNDVEDINDTLTDLGY